MKKQKGFPIKNRETSPVCQGINSYKNVWQLLPFLNRVTFLVPYWQTTLPLMSQFTDTGWQVP
jgi:hypothetical protein